ncbi:glycosyltransferase family 2 protein [Paenibacillus tyrfis]|uniref:glycosyltransferase family 2 protein n=1 Tax=Paenibacillus tyrfis TaxID=1501230 RepID=UPI0035B53BD3
MIPLREISVVIPVYNQAYPLSLTLYGFTRQPPPFDRCRIIVVDDGSSEPIEAVVEAYRDRLNIAYVRLPRKGRAAARNEGVRRLDEGIVVFCDADRIPRPGFLQAHYEAHCGAETRMAVGHVRELYVSEPERNRELVLERIRGETHDRVPQFCRLVYGLFDAEGGTSAAAAWVSTLSGNLSVPLELFRRLEGFDEHFHEWGFEHMEFGYRAHRQGCRFRYATRAVNVHLAHPRSGAPYEALIRQSHAYFYKKHPQPVIRQFLGFMMGHTSLRQLEQTALACEGNGSADSVPDGFVRITNF